MIPYYLLIAVPVLLRAISKKYRFTAGNKLLYETQTSSIDTFMFIFLLLLALRGLECGNDTRQYLRLYNEYSVQSVSRLLSSYRHEFGYKLLNRLVGVLAGDYQVLLAIVAVICVCPLWYFYRRESDNQLLTMALFLTVSPFLMYFSGIRQAIAMSMGVPAWYCVRKKKLFRLILVILLAIQFHTSAFVLALLYPMYHAKITKRWLWFVVPCMAAVYVFKTELFRFLMAFLWKDYSDITETGATTVLMLLIIFGVYCYVIPEEKDLDQDTVAMRNILLCSITLQFFAMLHPLAMRINYYLLLFVPILIPRIANRSKEKYAQIAKLSEVVMTVYFFYYFLSNGIRDNDKFMIFPYIPFWE